MAVLSSAAGTDLIKFVQSAVAKGQTIRTDGWSGYLRAEAAGFDHFRLVEGTPANAASFFPLVHTVFSNLKAWINGTFHGVSSTWLPAYIAEFNYRFNRRATTHSGGLWRFMLRRLMRGAWSPWTDRTAAFEARRAA